MGRVEKKIGSDFGSGSKIFFGSGFGFRVEKSQVSGNSSHLWFTSIGSILDLKRDWNSLWAKIMGFLEFGKVRMALKGGVNEYRVGQDKGAKNIIKN